MCAAIVLSDSAGADVGDVTGGGGRSVGALATVAQRVPIGGDVSASSLDGVGMVSRALSVRGSGGLHQEEGRIGGAVSLSSPAGGAVDSDDGSVLWAGGLLILALVARRFS